MSDKEILSGLNEEEKRRLERIERLDSNKKRKKIIFASVTVILVLFFVFGTVFGIGYILDFEGTQALPKENNFVTALPENEEEAVLSLQTLVSNPVDYEGTKLDVSFGVAVLDESIVISGDNSEAVRVYFDYIKDSLESTILSCYSDEGYTGKYGNDFSSVMFSLDINADDADITALINEENENELIYNIDFEGCEFSEVKNSKVYGIFDLESFDSAKNTLSEKFSSMATATDAKLTYEDFKVTARADRTKDRLTSVDFERVCNVTLPLTFIGEWAEFGNVNVSFSLKLVKSYRFTRVEFSFREDVFYIEKGSSDEFKVNIISDPSDSEASLTFVSSDPDILSVDGRFYKGEKISEKPVTVKGIYVYNGVEYTDECIFYVRVPVEGVKVTQKELSLKVGDTFTIEAKISPEDATLKQVYWFSTDENIASVDKETGEISGVSAGTVSVYCITLDGNYKSSCTVEVYE